MGCRCHLLTSLQHCIVSWTWTDFLGWFGLVWTHPSFCFIKKVHKPITVMHTLHRGCRDWVLSPHLHLHRSKTQYVYCMSMYVCININIKNIIIYRHNMYHIYPCNPISCPIYITKGTCNLRDLPSCSYLHMQLSEASKRFWFHHYLINECWCSLEWNMSVFDPWLPSLMHPTLLSHSFPLLERA